MSKLRGLSRRINKGKKTNGLKLEKTLKVRNGYLKLTFPLTPEQFKIWDVFVDYMMSFVYGDRSMDNIKKSINGIIAIINFMIDAVVNGINKVIGLLNNFKIEIPEWVPEWGGKEFALNIPKLEAPKIPYLANGAVIPPNAPFMAMLGDQRHGTNIEAPLATIEEALENVYRKHSNNGGSMTLHNVMHLNRRVVFDEMIEEARLRQTASGRNVFMTL